MIDLIIFRWNKSILKRHLRSNIYLKRYKSKKVAKTKESKYTSTVFLPKSTFPIWHSPEEEAKVQGSLLWKNFYSSSVVQHDNESKKQFWLHDGPPYANGQAHFGHAINKILKDIICRERILRGYPVKFIPGWDCHGLPIELRVQQEDQKKGISRSNPIELREAAARFAKEAIKDQMQAFLRWGVVGSWDNPYLTMDPHYIIKEIQAFYDLYKQGLIYRNYLPTYWSPSSKTALAEAELEYQDCVCNSAYVKFLINNWGEVSSSYHDKKVYLLVWTTTPWTLPANQAVAISKQLEYCVAHIDNETFRNELFIIAKDRIPDLQELFKSAILVKEDNISSLIQNLEYNHPFDHENNSQKVYPAQFVTASKGTGLVHIAPNHGQDDYQLARAFDLPIKRSLVDADGCLREEAGPRLSGLQITNGQADEAVLRILDDRVALIEEITHSYPHDWRTKEPVIINTSQQWFIDTSKLVHLCHKALEQVDFTPEGTKNYLMQQIEKRPHWCISRQRIWGTPIPVFYHREDQECLEPYVNQPFIDQLCRLIKERGRDAWWLSSNDDILLQNVLRESNLSGTSSDYKLGKDIFDVWFDSGLSWKHVLPSSVLADVYLEGVDQVRGWFQSSLLTSIALRGHAPYKKVFLHGFALDPEGRKMSKSLGNVVDPMAIVQGSGKAKGLGAETLRWFVARVGSTHANVSADPDSLRENFFPRVNKFRKVIRFMIGSLSDISLEEISLKQLKVDESLPLDRYMLHTLATIDSKLSQYHEDLKIHDAAEVIEDFITELLSNIYFASIKDRLYCDIRDAPERRSHQYVLLKTLDCVCKWLFPIQPYIITETMLHIEDKYPALRDLLFEWFDERPGKVPSTWNDPNLASSMEAVLQLRKLFYQKIKQPSGLNLNLQASFLSTRLYDHLQVFQPEQFSTNSQLVELLQVASIELVHTFFEDALEGDSDEEEITEKNIDEEKDEESMERKKPKGIEMDGEVARVKIKFWPTTNAVCPRCRKYVSFKENDLCSRCETVISELDESKL